MQEGLKGGWSRVSTHYHDHPTYTTMKPCDSKCGTLACIVSLTLSTLSLASPGLRALGSIAGIFKEVVYRSLQRLFSMEKSSAFRMQNIVHVSEHVYELLPYTPTVYAYGHLSKLTVPNPTRATYRRCQPGSRCRFY